MQKRKTTNLQVAKRLIKGFTLIELMVVMALMAVLATLIIGAITLARHTAVETTNRANAKIIQTAMEGYYGSNRSYPVVTDVSLQTVLGSAYLNVTTSLNSTCGAEAAVEGQNVEKTTGGGRVTSTATTYTITPYNWNCSVGQSGSILTAN